MLSRAWALYEWCANPPPVQMSEVSALLRSIEKVDRDIRAVQNEQSHTTDVYRFAVMEYEIEELLGRRSALSRKKASLLSRARKQGPNVDCSLYEKLV